MSLFERLINKEQALSVIGLGYVGLPIAVAFARKLKVIGFDINREKVELYKKGIDVTKEVGDEALRTTSALFTSDEAMLKEAAFHIIAVPTPVREDHTPDLRPVTVACEIVGRNLKPGSIVVLESTVYPGVTEEVCVPILEQASGLKSGVDFKVGYSPERINPGDKVHRLETIVKVVSGMDEESLELIARVYGLVVEAGIYKAESIKVAEAAKVIENSQRDINIAFMNELSIIFNRMGISTKAVLEAAATKWNFLKFTPGLVGGHCIGVDPYYLTYKAEQLRYHSQVILSGRRINDDMGRYVVENLIKHLIKADIPVKNARVAILGFTFKENCPDTRNTRVYDIVTELRDYGITAAVCDPLASPDEVEEEYGIKLLPFDEIRDMDAVVIAVAHNNFLSITEKDLGSMFKADAMANEKRGRVVFDLKGILDRKRLEEAGYLYWSL